MSLVLVRSSKHAKLIQLETLCDEEFFKWHEQVEDLESKWDEMGRLDVDGFIDESRTLALQTNSLHAKSVEQWFTYLQARDRYISYEESISGGYDTTKLRGKL